MTGRPGPADPDLERLARAVEAGTFRALARSAIVVTIPWVVIAVVLPVLFVTVSRSVEPPVFLAIVAVLAGALAVLAIRALRPRA